MDTNKLNSTLQLLRNCRDLNELKTVYRALIFQNHPDKGGDEELTKAINVEFSKLFEILKNQHNAKADYFYNKGEYNSGVYTTTETPEEFIEIINILSKIQGIYIELCGSWLWISGNTKENKDALKAAGCCWSKNKSMWYWRHKENYCRKKNNNYLSIDEIREQYGSQTMKAEMPVVV